VKTAVRIIIFAAVGFTARQAFSCSCGGITPSDGFDHAEAVFTGTVIEASKSKWTISVQRVWKGDVQSVVILRDAHSGTSCGSRLAAAHLKVNRKPEFERRIVEDSEYVALVNTLAQSTTGAVATRRTQCTLARVGRCSATLRMTGARFNELLTMKLDQFQWSKGKLRLDASKPKNERTFLSGMAFGTSCSARLLRGLNTGSLV
jgi:hypothetical protein